jgi:hypothetical protein
MDPITLALALFTPGTLPWHAIVAAYIAAEMIRPYHHHLTTTTKEN